MTALAVPTATGAGAPRIDGLCTRVGNTATVTLKGTRVALRCVRTGTRKVWKAQAPAKSTATTSRPGVIGWQEDGNGDFVPTGKPPACGSITWTFPLTGLDQVESILYPGQVRGNDYKPHGGFRTRTAEIRVSSPIPGYVIMGARSLESPTGQAGVGEVQHWIEIQHPCGLAVRFDHLKVLSPALQAVFDRDIPLRTDSRSTFLPTPLWLDAGDLVATAVGFTETGVNTFVDFGTYDLRARTPSRRSEAEMRTFPSFHRGLHGVCWFALFGPALEGEIRALPAADGKSGKQSDYC